MAPPSEHVARVAARIEGAVALDLAVERAEDVLGGLCELRLAGDLAGFHPWPGQDLMVSVPPASATPRFRRYTVRRWDPDAGTVDVWVTTTTDGPGAAWAIGAAAGDHVEAVGPRGKIGLRDDASLHVFVVDESGLAAKCAMAEAITGPAEVFCLSLLVHNPEMADASAIEPSYAAEVSSRTHLLDPAEIDWAATVLDVATRSDDRTTAAGYVFCELGQSRKVAAALVDLGFHADRVAVKPYWRDGRANAANGEPERDDASE